MGGGPTGDDPNELLIVRYLPDDLDDEQALNLSSWPGSRELRLSFAEALRHVTGPIGTWRRSATVVGSTRPVKSFVGWLAERGIDAVAQLTPAVWNEWRVNLTSPQGRDSSVMAGRERLLDCRVAVLALPGLREDTARVVEMRIGRVHRVGDKPFYTKSQFDAIQVAALRTVRAAHRRVTGNWQLVVAFQEDPEAVPAEQRPKAEALASLMRHGEPQSDEECIAAGGSTGKSPNRAKASAQLWLTRSEGVAVATWLTTLTGEDWSVINRKKMPSTAASLGDGEAVFFTRDSKPRRGPHHHDQPSPWRSDDTDTSVGRALQLIVEACAPARAFRVARGLNAEALIYTRSSSKSSRSWQAPEPGIPLHDANDRNRHIRDWWPWSMADGPGLNFTALRNTHQAGAWKGGQVPAGHTYETHLQYRLGNPSQVEAGRDAALAGLQDALDVAREFIAVQIRSVDDVDPNQDMIGVSCADHEHHPSTGESCQEPFLACFGCTNACITPRFLPVDVLILDGLENLRAVLPAQRWQKRFLRYYLQVLSVLQQAGVDEQRRIYLRGQASEAQRLKVARAFAGVYE